MKKNEKINEFVTPIQQQISKRINEKHSKWLERIKEYVKNLPDGEEKNKLLGTVNQIENR